MRCAGALSAEQLSQQQRRCVNWAEKVQVRCSFSVEIFFEEEGSAPVADLGKVAGRAKPPLLRFCLSHFRRRSTTSKPIGLRRARNSSCGDARFVPRTPSLVMAAAANRLMINTMIGSGFGAASAIAAARRSPSCRPFLLPTVITASSPAARRYSATSWKTVPGKLRPRQSKIRIASPIPRRCGGGSAVWIPHGRRFRFYAR